MSEAFQPDNLLDRRSDPATLQVHYDHGERRERELLERRLGMSGGDVLSVGCGWHPGRHLFPRPAWRLTGVDLDPAMVEDLLGGRDRRGSGGARGRAAASRRSSFDVVLYRLVLHHIAFQGRWRRRSPRRRGCCAREARSWPSSRGCGIRSGAGLALANRTGLGTRVHGTPDDIPLSPRELERLARGVGLEPELHAVTFGWRRLPQRAQRALHRLDPLGSRPRLARFGHTLLLIARRSSASGMPNPGAASTGERASVQPSRS